MWKLPPPLFVDPTSAKDPVVQLLEGLEEHIAKSPADERAASQTPMLGARLSYRNALHLYKSSTDLVAQGEFGAGRSLAILALEEFGRAWIYSMLDIGLYSTEQAGQGARPYIDPRVFKCHRCKQGLVYAVEIGWSAMGLLQVFPTEADLGGEEANAEVAAQFLARYVEKLAASPPTLESVKQKLEAAPVEVARIQTLFSDRSAMENTKWEGFYVNYEAEPPTTPQKLSRESYEKFRAFVARRLLDFSSYFLAEFPEEEWVKIKAVFSALDLPSTELLCPRDPEAEHPITAKRLAEWKAKRAAESARI